jgi:hypothetical protein
VVKRTLSSGVRPQVGGGIRGRVVCLSEESARRLKFVARNCRGFTTMLTLTYPASFPRDGLVFKDDLRQMCQWLKRRGVAGLWYLEFQDRGAPHFHLYLTGRVPFHQVAQAWYRIVGSGDPRHLVAGTRIEAIRQPHAVAVYAAKYATKAVQKDVPAEVVNVGRFWGLFGGLKPEPDAVISGELSGAVPLVVDEETGEFSEGVGVAQVVRVLRSLWGSYRRRRGLRSWPDGGRFSFTLWGVGAPSLSAVGRLGFPTGRAVSAVCGRTA